METEMDNIEFLVGSDEYIGVVDLPVLEIFDLRVIDFFDKLSLKIMNERDCRRFPDILTFGFWCRKANLLEISKIYFDHMLHLGRGIVFHVTPSNLPVIFAYSLAAGLLSGNANIVKLPTKEFKQITYFITILRALLQEKQFDFLLPYITCIRYEHQNTAITQILCSVSDAKMIWGGDSTVDDIRRHKAPPRCVDIAFSERYSISIIDSETWLSCTSKERLIRGFYTDTYLFDQNACSAPVLVAWTGENIQKARDDFWHLLEEIVRKEYLMQDYLVIKKLESFYRLCTVHPDVKIVFHDNYIMRIWTPHIDNGLMDLRPGGGFFIECSVQELSELRPLLTSKCQTVTYHGIAKDELMGLLRSEGPQGIDRIVPIGNALDFSLVWDGHDLIRSLSRAINIS
jgi:hypothetical protein